jgi:hypothetical protein
MLKQCSISTEQGVPVARSTALAAASHAAADATPRRNTRAGVPVRSASVRADCTSSAMSGSLATVLGLWRIAWRPLRFLTRAVVRTQNRFCHKQLTCLRTACERRLNQQRC